MRPILRLLRLKVRRPYSTGPSIPPGPNPSKGPRIPPSLLRYASALKGAPVTHITSFLLLHELTAIIPLFTLTYVFHLTGLSNTVLGWFPEERVAKMRAYLRKKRDRDGWTWLGDVDGEGRGGWVVGMLASYAIVKAAIPARIGVSLWATPWFARRVVGPMGGWVGRVRGKGKRSGSGTGVGGGEAGKV